MPLRLLNGMQSAVVGSTVRGGLAAGATGKSAWPGRDWWSDWHL